MRPPPKVVNHGTWMGTAFPKANPLRTGTPQAVLLIGIPACARWTLYTEKEKFSFDSPAFAGLLPRQ
jgi:hypothetical protein